MQFPTRNAPMELTDTEYKYKYIFRFVYNETKWQAEHDISAKGCLPTNQTKQYWQHTRVYFEEDCKKKIPGRTQQCFNFFFTFILREVRISQFAWCQITPTNHKY